MSRCKIHQVIRPENIEHRTARQWNTIGAAIEESCGASKITAIVMVMKERKRIFNFFSRNQSTNKYEK